MTNIQQIQVKVINDKEEYQDISKGLKFYLIKQEEENYIGLCCAEIQSHFIKVKKENCEIVIN